MHIQLELNDTVVWYMQDAKAKLKTLDYYPTFEEIL